MRFTLNRQTTHHGEQQGYLIHRPLLLHKHRFIGRDPSVVRTLQPISLRTVSWVAFLFFWVIFGRALLFYFMTVGVDYIPSSGIPIVVDSIPLSGDQVDALLAGEEVIGHEGPIAFDLITNTIQHVRIRKDGSLEMGGSSWDAAAIDDFCTRSEFNQPVVFLSFSREMTYADAISAIDSVRSTGIPGCLPEVLFTVAP